MSHPYKLLSSILEPWTTIQGSDPNIRLLPPIVTDSAVMTSWPREARRALRALLARVSGIDGTPIGHIDFTAAWHNQEVPGVLCASMTFAIDGAARRWVVEVDERGLGSVWCIYTKPQVIVLVATNLQAFFEMLRRHVHFQTHDEFLKRLDEAAQRCWQFRGALAFSSRIGVKDDSQVRRWLLQLPRDARVYDLRSSGFGSGFPYGAAGPSGELHRCGNLPLFAVSGFPAPVRWNHYLGDLSERIDIPRPRALSSPATHQNGLCESGVGR